MRLAIGMALGLLASGCGAPDGSRPEGAARRADQCFNAASVNSFNPVIGRGAVDVRVGANRHYRLTLGAGCLDIDWANRVALRSRSGTNFICGAADAEIIAPSMGARGADRCTVVEVRRLTQAEVEASRARRN